MPYGFDGLTTRTTMPISGGTVNGTPFSVPRRAVACTVHVPALVGTGATVKFQSLQPPIESASSETWQDLSTFDVVAGAMQALDGFVESTTVTIPVAVLGGGVLRLVASESQASASVTIPVYFHIVGA